MDRTVDYARRYNVMLVTYLAAPKTPNQAMQPTAGRSDVPLQFMKICTLQATLDLASGG
jgi:hypothetical protein